jgi:hypothetical protein
MTMSSRERMHTAMHMGVPDRVPVMCQLSVGHYFRHTDLEPMDIWFRSEGFAEALVQLQRRYRFDGILVNLPGRDPDFDQHIDRVEEKTRREETWVWWKNGNYTIVPHDDNPHYFQSDRTRYFPTFEEVTPDHLWYVEPWDLTDITYPYTWGFDLEPRNFEDYFPEFHTDTIRAVKSRVGDEVSVHGEVFSPFAQFLELLNYEHALLALIDDPAKTHACLGRLTEGTIQLATAQAKAGVDAILISSAFAGAGLISRQNYEEFVLPYERRLVQTVKAATDDIVFYTHTCGAIGDRLDLMLASGTNGIDTLDPPPLGTVELDQAVEQLKGKAFIKGNLDPVTTLLQGSVDDVEQAVMHRINVAGQGGEYILSSACSVAPRTKPENIEMLAQLVAEHGRYGCGGVLDG